MSVSETIRTCGSGLRDWISLTSSTRRPVIVDASGPEPMLATYMVLPSSDSRRPW